MSVVEMKQKLTGVASQGCQSGCVYMDQVYALIAVPGHLTSPWPVGESKWTS